MIRPTEVKAEDLSVGYPVNGTQNATSLGATTKEASKVSLFKASSFTIHYQTVNSTTNKVHTHTLTYKFRSLSGKYDTEMCIRDSMDTTNIKNTTEGEIK